MIVYIHKRLSDNEVFYVGIGKTKKRAVNKEKLGPFWNNYIAKYAYTYEILYENLSYEEAYSKEKELIAFYGRRDLGKGTLVNMTDGCHGGATMTGRKNPSLSELNKKRKGIPISSKY